MARHSACNFNGDTGLCPYSNEKPIQRTIWFRGPISATRALSVTVVENDFVEAVYDKIAKVYDLTFGPTLHPGRLQAIQRMDIQPGERVLEVGVGTGINLSLYPKNCSVTGIDFSGSMLEIARERAARKEIRNVRLLQMDAADLKFADDSFDIVYAPYLISVVPDPVKVAQEMRRVCRPGGRIIVLNHFLSPESDPLAHRAPDLAVHDSHRLQGRPRPPGISRPGRSPAAVDRKGEHPEALVARHHRQVAQGSPQNGCSSDADGVVKSFAPSSVMYISSSRRTPNCPRRCRCPVRR